MKKITTALSLKCYGEVLVALSDINVGSLGCEVSTLM